MPSATDVSFGVLLNMGGHIGTTPDAVFDLTLRQATAAEELGYSELWVTEHHFIRFGINPSALTAAAFLLGRTTRVRVGTSVVLSPLCHPVELAERAALLDHLSAGRFDLGIGRGGYRRDYEVLEVDFARWDDEPQASAQRLIDLWTGQDPVAIQPPSLSTPHPPLFLATTSEAGLKVAAHHGLALQHYFATPVEARLTLEDRYRGYSADDSAPAHLHTLIVVVDSHPDRRLQLAAALERSFHAGAHAHVPQAPDRHLGPDGRPMDPSVMARHVADNAIVGPASQVVDELGRFLSRTAARRIAIYHEAIADPDVTMQSLEDFAVTVMPQLTAVG